ncbi:hypothetical protein C8J57DRAFT_1542027 [Mycena rebaudengoi]|nr:hypothetical protein C8J57DRAFT_1542027 [Mycena rebaudengoi]
MPTSTPSFASSPPLVNTPFTSRPPHLRAPATQEPPYLHDIYSLEDRNASAQFPQRQRTGTRPQPDFPLPEDEPYTAGVKAAQDWNREYVETGDIRAVPFALVGGQAKDPRPADRHRRACMPPLCGIRPALVPEPRNRSPILGDRHGRRNLGTPDPHYQHLAWNLDHVVSSVNSVTRSMANFSAPDFLCHAFPVRTTSYRRVISLHPPGAVGAPDADSLIDPDPLERTPPYFPDPRVPLHPSFTHPPDLSVRILNRFLIHNATLPEGRYVRHASWQWMGVRSTGETIFVEPKPFVNQPEGAAYPPIHANYVYLINNFWTSIPLTSENRGEDTIPRHSSASPNTRILYRFPPANVQLPRPVAEYNGDWALITPVEAYRLRHNLPGPEAPPRVLPRFDSPLPVDDTSDSPDPITDHTSDHHPTRDSPRCADVEETLDDAETYDDNAEDVDELDESDESETFSQGDEGEEDLPRQRHLSRHTRRLRHPWMRPRLRTSRPQCARLIAYGAALISPGQQPPEPLSHCSSFIQIHSSFSDSEASSSSEDIAPYDDELQLKPTHLRAPSPPVTPTPPAPTHPTAPQSLDHLAAMARDMLSPPQSPALRIQPPASALNENAEDDEHERLLPARPMSALRFPLVFTAVIPEAPINPYLPVDEEKSSVLFHVNGSLNGASKYTDKSDIWTLASRAPPSSTSGSPTDVSGDAVDDPDHFMGEIPDEDSVYSMDTDSELSSLTDENFSTEEAAMKGDINPPITSYRPMRNEHGRILYGRTKGAPADALARLEEWPIAERIEHECTGFGMVMSLHLIIRASTLPSTLYRPSTWMRRHSRRSDPALSTFTSYVWIAYPHRSAQSLPDDDARSMRSSGPMKLAESFTFDDILFREHARINPLDPVTRTIDPRFPFGRRASPETSDSEEPDAKRLKVAAPTPVADACTAAADLMRTDACAHPRRSTLHAHGGGVATRTPYRYHGDAAVGGTLSRNLFFRRTPPTPPSALARPGAGTPY